MAQLTDDCFAFGGAMMSLDEAVARIKERIVPVADSGIVPLADALGCVLAGDVHSRVAIPSSDNSAVDGYAVRHADLFQNSIRYSMLKLAGFFMGFFSVKIKDINKESFKHLVFSFNFDSLISSFFC